jgi:AcrR family transcriptional regulator
LEIKLHDGGTYVCTEGPRFETKAEIKAFANMGADVVGMTNVPEVILAKEAGMSQSNLHYYYPTKDDIMFALLDELQVRFSKRREASIDIENRSLAENLHGLFEEKKDDILNHKKVDYAQLDFWVQGTVDQRIRAKFQNTFDEWRQNIAEVLRTEKLPEGVDPKNLEMLPFLAVSFMMGASMQYLIDEGKFSLDDYFAAGERIILGYLGKVK